MRVASSLAATAGAILLVACGSSPTEPTNAQSPRTTLKITVTQCDLGGSVLVLTDGPGNAPATLPTPGEVTLSLTPGPHSLSFQRGNQVFAGTVVAGSEMADPLGAIPPGATASITLVDPPGACMAVPAH
jgi:hypothetical protein